MSLSVEALREMFPALSDDVLAATLEACGDEAIAALLEMCVDNDDLAGGGVGPWGRHDAPPTTSARPGPDADARGTGHQQRRGGHAGSTGDPSKRSTSTGQLHRSHGGLRKTWGQLRAAQEQQPQGIPGSTLRPEYIEAGAAIVPALAAADFPGLASPQPTSARLQPAAPSQAYGLSDGHTHPGCGRGGGGGAGRSHMAADGGGWPSPRPLSFTGPPAAAPVRLAGPAAWDGRAQGAWPQPQQPPLAVASGNRYLQVGAQAHRPQPHASPQRPPGPMRAVSSWPSFVEDVERNGARGAWAEAWGGGLAGVGAAAVGQGGGAESESGGGSGWRECAVEELCRTHGWAGRDLIEAVCLALQYDMAEVVAALDELRAATFQARPSGSASSAASASSSAASSDAASREASGADDSDAHPGGGGVRAAGAPLRAGRGPRTTAAAAAGGPARVEGAGGGGRRSGRRGEANLGGDAYTRHREEALKLTHAWRKKMDKASAAFSSGQRALGRQLVEDAQEVRRAAAAKHLEAAARIEAELNGGRQLSEWELDLHGLHGDEAVEALARRLAALQAATPESRPLERAPGGPRKQAPAAAEPASAAPAAGSSSRADGGEGYRWGAASRALASRRVLQVIVGRGLHSARGEASLPRVIEAFLQERGYRFTPRAGQIEVQLPRSFRGPASAAAAAPHRRQP